VPALDVPATGVPVSDVPVRIASAWDALDDVPFGATPSATNVPMSFTTPFDDLTAFERPRPLDREAVEKEPAALAPAAHDIPVFDPGALDAENPFETEPAFEATALEPTVLDDRATFEEPASFDMPAPIEAAEPEAAPVEAEPEPDVLEDLQEYVVFSLGDMRCVVPIRNVIEVGRIPDAAPVPNSPPWLHGLGNLRGQVLTLIDLKAFFGIGRIKQATGRMVVLRADADEITGAVMVDQVHQIVSLSPSRFRAAPTTLPEKSTQFVWGACDYGNFTMIGLDVDGVLGVESMTEAAAEAAV
jgi:purine-binding chemotaxis protein CheW